MLDKCLVDAWIITMRAQLSDKNVSRLESVTDIKITKNCDQVLGKALDELETLKSEKEENDSLDMSTCDETKKEMGGQDA